jgi:hypothetical protein
MNTYLAITRPYLHISGNSINYSIDVDNLIAARDDQNQQTHSVAYPPVGRDSFLINI